MGQRVINKNTLFYGDNLDILRQYIADESVDLIYLDPPFNSSRNHNVLYKDESGEESQSQILAFEDTWHWSKDKTEPEFLQLQENSDNLSDLLTTLVRVMGRNQMSAYLVMMSNRLIELHRVLKPTGSLYLHCDPSASHYLKMILDMIFGAGNFRNEIIWRRTDSTGSSKSIAKRFPSNADMLLFYTKSDTYFFEHIRADYSEKYKARFTKKDDRGWYYSDNLKTYSKERLEQLISDNRIEYTKHGKPRIKNYLHEGKGTISDNVWIDILPINSQAQERLGYPTQKPIALLERILSASSNPGDIVLDPFCGCGTAIHAAQKSGRIWAGIDITPLATTLIKSRLYDAFGIEAKKDYDIFGEPVTLADAHHLAKQDRYLFQWWALGLLPARPHGGQADKKEGKKGADKGIDGIMTFQDSAGGAHKRIIVQVKSGKVSSRDIRDLNGTVDREKNAAIGVFITLENPTRNMEMEALEIGRYKSEGFNRDYRKIQILTIEQLLAGEKVQFPGTDTTLKQAQREQQRAGEQQLL
jgi:site-specific DNA-methyltransferase (adenine-specific)